MRKKWMAVILASVMAFSLSACGGSGAASEEKTEETADKEETKTEEKKEDKLSIEETVLLDWEGLKITATGIEKKENRDTPWLKLLVENDTSYGVSIEVSSLLVNGCYIQESSFGMNLADIPAGKKANEKLYLGSSGVNLNEIAGIGEIGMIDVEFTVRDSSMDYYDDASILVKSELINLHTSAYDDMDTSAMAEGTELYNQNGIRIVTKGLDEYAKDYNYALYLYAENTTDKDIVIDSYDVSVDGFVPDEYSGSLNSFRIPAGKCSVEGMVFYYDETVTDPAAIKDIKEVQFGLKAYDEANWTWGYDDTGLIADTGVLTYNQ